MPQSTDRQRTSWFRPGSPNLSMRVSDAERAEVADRLARHFSDGRLDRAEFDERVSRAMAARTFGDLQGLFDDLPDLAGTASDATADAPSGDDPGYASGAGRPAWTPPGSPAMRRGHRRGPIRLLLTFVLIVVAANITWHALTFWFTPVMWLAILAIIIVVLSRRNHPPGQ